MDYGNAKRSQAPAGGYLVPLKGIPLTGHQGWNTRIRTPLIQRLNIKAITGEVKIAPITKTTSASCRGEPNDKVPESV